MRLALAAVDQLESWEQSDVHPPAAKSIMATIAQSRTYCKISLFKYKYLTGTLPPEVSLQDYLESEFGEQADKIIVLAVVESLKDPNRSVLAYLTAEADEAVIARKAGLSVSDMDANEGPPPTADPKKSRKSTKKDQVEEEECDGTQVPRQEREVMSLIYIILYVIYVIMQ